MIGRIAGRIDYRGPDHVLIDVRGVGYIVHVSERTLAALPGVGEAAALYTDLLVREDLLQLFGFLTLAEKEWHRLLTSVQGVGAKASLAILGNLFEVRGCWLDEVDCRKVRDALSAGPNVLVQQNVAAPQRANIHDRSDNVLTIRVKYECLEGEKRTRDEAAIANLDLLLLVAVICLGVLR